MVMSLQTILVLNLVATNLAQFVKYNLHFLINNSAKNIGATSGQLFDTNWVCTTVI